MKNFHKTKGKIVKQNYNSEIIFNKSAGKN